MCSRFSAEAFKTLKMEIVSEPVLKLPELNKPFEVYTDALDHALGGLLMQERHPVAFESWKLKDVEVRHSTNEKEMIPLFRSLETISSQHKVCGDHRQFGQHLFQNSRS